jgi:hypothetical protein
MEIREWHSRSVQTKPKTPPTPTSSAFGEFSIFSLPDFLSSRLFTFPLGSLWGQRAPTQNRKEELNAPENSSRCSRDFWEI